MITLPTLRVGQTAKALLKENNDQ